MQGKGINKEKKKRKYYGGVKMDVFETYNYGSSFLRSNKVNPTALTNKSRR
jgi:hypothetical protein